MLVATAIRNPEGEWGKQEQEVTQLTKKRKKNITLEIGMDSKERILIYNWTVKSARKWKIIKQKQKQGNEKNRKKNIQKSEIGSREWEKGTGET